MAARRRKRSIDNPWNLPPIRIDGRKRAECVVREARCLGAPDDVRKALEQAVALELGRMRALNQSDESIRAFLSATDIHIALCGGEPPLPDPDRTTG